MPPRSAGDVSSMRAITALPPRRRVQVESKLSASHVEGVSGTRYTIRGDLAEHVTYKTRETQRDRDRLRIASGVPVQLGERENLLEDASCAGIAVVVDDLNRRRNVAVGILTDVRQIARRVKEAAPTDFGESSPQGRVLAFADEADVACA